MYFFVKSLFFFCHFSHNYCTFYFAKECLTTHKKQCSNYHDCKDFHNFYLSFVPLLYHKGGGLSSVFHKFFEIFFIFFRERDRTTHPCVSQSKKSEHMFGAEIGARPTVRAPRNKKRAFALLVCYCKYFTGILCPPTARIIDKEVWCVANVSYICHSVHITFRNTLEAFFCSCSKHIAPP